MTDGRKDFPKIETINFHINKENKIAISKHAVMVSLQNNSTIFIYKLDDGMYSIADYIPQHLDTHYIAETVDDVVEFIKLKRI